MLPRYCRLQPLSGGYYCYSHLCYYVVYYIHLHFLLSSVRGACRLPSCARPRTWTAAELPGPGWLRRYYSASSSLPIPRGALDCPRPRPHPRSSRGTAAGRGPRNGAASGTQTSSSRGIGRRRRPAAAWAPTAPSPRPARGACPRPPKPPAAFPPRRAAGSAAVYCCCCCCYFYLLLM
jgi:hypothetical protein